MLQVKNLFVDLGGFRLTADFEIERMVYSIPVYYEYVRVCK